MTSVKYKNSLREKLRKAAHRFGSVTIDVGVVDDETMHFSVSGGTTIGGIRYGFGRTLDEALKSFMERQ